MKMSGKKETSKGDETLRPTRGLNDASLVKLSQTKNFQWKKILKKHISEVNELPTKITRKNQESARMKL